MIQECCCLKEKDSDVDLKAIFNEMADQSTKYCTELTQQVTKFGGDPAEQSLVVFFYHGGEY